MEPNYVKKSPGKNRSEKKSTSTETNLDKNISKKKSG
jgi:hypothetical protein